jgi:4-alpha-glucanotransferase
MNELSILSLEIQRAPKTDKIEFFHPADAPYLSVVTPSTHDMSTIRGWWEEDREVSQRFYNHELGHWGDAPYFCEWWVCRDILVQHLYSPAMWAIFQWQDLMSISPELRRDNPEAERINVPSNSYHSWRYRMHINLEDLMNENEFNDTLRNYIKQAGR